MNYVNYPCGCSASKGSPTYCPTHMTAMPLIREYAQFMYEAGYANERPDGDYSTEAADFERRIAVLAAQQPAPADAEDMKVYKAISDNYFNSVAPAPKVSQYGSDEMQALIIDKLAAPAAQRLTDAEITAIYHSVYFNAATGRAIDFARAIERAHGIGKEQKQ